MPRLGTQIGNKFTAGGAARRYPGNTVISDVGPDCPAHAALLGCRELLWDSALRDHYILLPGGSYHMTVIRGLNDAVRTDAFWPPALPKDAPMSAADGFVADAVAAVPSPGPFRMRFLRMRASDEDLRALLEPETPRELARVRAYRDAVAGALGLRLPGHDAYTFHMTLAYTRLVPEGEDAAALAALTARMDALLSACAPFAVDAPHVAFYDDMLCFSRERLPRAAGVQGKGEMQS